MIFAEESSRETKKEQKVKKKKRKKESALSELGRGSRNGSAVVK